MTNTITLRKVLFLTTIFFPFYVLGINGADIIASMRHNNELSNYLKDVKSNTCNNYSNIVVFIFLVGIFVFVLYLKKIPFVPILSVISPQGKSPMYFRFAAVGDLFEGKIWWHKYFYAYIPYFISYIAFYNALNERGKKWKIISITIIVYCIFISIFDIQKAPIIFYLISLFFVYYAFKPNVKSKISVYLLTSGLAIILVILMYVFFMGRDYKNALTEATHRALTGQIQGLYGIIEDFSDEYLWGKSFPPFFINVLGINFYDLDREMKLYIHFYIDPSTGMVGRAPTVYFGEVYANFGLLITFISMIFVPFVLRLIDNIFLYKAPRNSIFLSFYIFLIFHYKDLALSRFSPFLFDAQLILMIFILLIINASYRRKCSRGRGVKNRLVITER